MRSNAEGRCGRSFADRWKTFSLEPSEGEQMDEYKTVLTESLIVWVSSDSLALGRVFIPANAFLLHLLVGGGGGGGGGGSGNQPSGNKGQI